MKGEAEWLIGGISLEEAAERCGYSVPSLKRRLRQDDIPKELYTYWHGYVFDQAISRESILGPKRTAKKKEDE